MTKMQADVSIRQRWLLSALTGENLLRERMLFPEHPLRDIRLAKVYPYEVTVAHDRKASRRH